MLTAKNAFPEQVQAWLSGLGFGVSAIKQGIFTRLLIFNQERQILELVLICLHQWQECGTQENFLKEIARIKAIRQTGLRSILIWEDLWISKDNIVRSRISALLGFSQKIPARLTKVRRIDKGPAQQFLDANHLNGATTSKFRFGLFLPNRYFRILESGFQVDQEQDELLVAAATFSTARTFQRNGTAHQSYELIRFANVLGSNVVGGLDKLLRAFERDRQPGDIMTYADSEWSDGASYQILGFEMKEEKPPISILLDTENMHRRITGRQHLIAEPGSSDLLIYNMGSVKFVRNTSEIIHE